jgi:hypothetical protein
MSNATEKTRKEPPVPGLLERIRKLVTAFLERDKPVEPPPKPRADDESAAPLRSCESNDHHHAEILMDAWKKMIDVQQHFNDIELRIRNFAVTVFAASFGALAYALEKPSELNLFGFRTPLTSGVIVVALTSWLAFYFMDRWWYHQLLIGSVLKAVDLENQLARHFTDIELTKRIGDSSPIKYGYPTLVAAVGILLLPIARYNPVLAHSFFGFALAVAIVTYRGYRRSWPKGEQFNFLKRWGANDVVMLGGIVTSWLIYGRYLQTAITILTVSLFLLTNRMARHRKNWRVRSTQKVDLFYLVGFVVLFSVGVMLHFSPPKTASAAAAAPIGGATDTMDTTGTTSATGTTRTTGTSGTTGTTGETGPTGETGTSGTTGTGPPSVSKHS